MTQIALKDIKYTSFRKKIKKGFTFFLLIENVWFRQWEMDLLLYKIKN